MAHSGHAPPRGTPNGVAGAHASEQAGRAAQAGDGRWRSAPDSGAS